MANQFVANSFRAAVSPFGSRSYRWRNAFHLGQTQQLVHLPFASAACCCLGRLDMVDNASLVVENVIGKEIRLTGNNAWQAASKRERERERNRFD